MTLTIPTEMLTRLENEAEAQGKDRLALLREALADYLKHTPTPKTSAKRK